MTTIKIQSSELKSAMAVLDKVSREKDTFPVYDNIRIERTPDRVVLTASNGSTQISVPLWAHGGGTAFVGLMPLQQVKALAQQDGETTVAIHFEENGRYTAMFGGNRLAGEWTTATDFAMIDESSEGGSTYRWPILRSAMKSVDFARASDQSRPIMTTTLIHDNEDGTTDIVATDGRVIVKAETRARIQGDAAETTITPALVKILLSLAGSERVGIKTTFDVHGEGDKQTKEARNIVVTFGDIVIISKAMYGRYPNYNAVFPKDAVTIVSAGRAQLTSAIGRITPYVGVKVKMEVSYKMLSVSGKDADFGTTAETSMPVFQHGDDYKIGISPDLIGKVLAALSGQQVTIGYYGLNKTANPLPITMQGGDESVTALIMPMLLDDDKPEEQKPTEAGESEAEEDGIDTEAVRQAIEGGSAAKAVDEIEEEAKSFVEQHIVIGGAGIGKE